MRSSLSPPEDKDQEDQCTFPLLGLVCRDRDVSSHLVSFLPENVLSQTGISCEMLHGDTEDEFRNRTKHHFPRYHERMTVNPFDPEKPGYLDENVSWSRHFHRAQEAEYRNLDSDARVLFTLVKQKNIEQLRQFLQEKQWGSEYSKMLFMACMDSHGKRLFDYLDKDDRDLREILLNYYKKTCPCPNCNNFLDVLFHQNDSFLAAYNQGGDMSLNRKRAQQFFERAMLSGNLVVIKTLREHFPHIKNKMHLSQSALEEACRGNYVHIIDYMMAEEKIEFDDETIKKGLLTAARYNNIEAFEKLSAGKDLNALFDSRVVSLSSRGAVNVDKHPLYLAIACGSADIIKRLVEQYPALARLNNHDAARLSPLAFAAHHGDVQLVEYLIAKGANLESPQMNEERVKKLGHVGVPFSTVRLIHYLHQHKANQALWCRSTRSGSYYKTRLGLLFGQTFGAYAKDDKEKAAKALYQVIMRGEDPEILEKHLGALSCGTLGKIYSACQSNYKEIDFPQKSSCLKHFFN